MPKHKRVTTCRKSGGTSTQYPLSKHCSCEHCTLDVCSVCGGGEGSLTTDCPNVTVDADRHQEICETRLDYTDDRGWYLAELTKHRSPRFEVNAEPAICQDCGTRCPPDLGPTYGCQICGSKNVKAGDHAQRADPRALIAPSIDWAAVDRNTDLQHELAKKAIAWVLADRTCEEHSAAIARIESAVGVRMATGDAPPDIAGALLAKLEREKIDFRIADQRAQRHDDEFRQVARRLVDALEEAALRRRCER